MSEPDDRLETLATPGPRSAPATGASLGAYEIVSELGRGGYGSVHEALHPVLGRVALKVLRRRGSAEVQFAREGRLVLDHPGIPRVLDHGEVDGAMFLAQELVDGVPLSELLAEGPLPEARALDVAARIADVLEHAHGRGIVHRDLKPSNVLVDPGGGVHVLDFGIAQVRRLADPGDSGAPIGTPAYMAPEQVRGGNVGPTADLYALGVILYELVADALPFDDATPVAQLLALVSGEPVPLSRRKPDASPEIRELVARLMARSPANRPRSAAEAAAWMRGILGGERSEGPRDRLARAAAGAGSVVLLFGTEGAARLAELEAAAAELGLAVCRGRGSARGGPHHALLEALGDPPGLPPADADVTRDQVLDAFAAHATDRARRSPMLLSLERGDLVDDGTLDALERLAPDLATLPCLVAIHASGSSDDLAGFEERLSRRGRVLRAGTADAAASGEDGGDGPAPDPATPAELAAQGRLAAKRWAYGLARRRYAELASRRDDAVAPAERLVALSELARIDRIRGGGVSRALLEEAVAVATSVGDRRACAQALREIGIVDLDAGRPADAKVRLEEALALALEEGDATMQGSCLTSLGVAHRDLGDRGQALRSFRDALALFQARGDTYRQAPCLNNLATLLADMGELHESLRRHEEAFAIRSGAGDTWGASSSLVNIGNVLGHLGRLAEARGCFERAIEMRRQGGERRRLAVPLMLLANLIAMDGQEEAALPLLDEVLDPEIDTPPQSLAGCLEIRGSILLGAGRRDEAAESLHRALALYRGIGLPTGEARVLTYLGVLSHEEGRCAEALARLHQAIDLGGGLLSPVDRLDVALAIGVCVAGAGDPSGLALIAACVRRADARGYPLVRVRARIELARAAAMAPDGREEARRAAREAVALAQELSLRRYSVEALRLWEQLG